MYYYAATLIFLTIIGSVASHALRTQGISYKESNLITAHVEAQRKAADRALRKAWLKSGELLEKKTSVPKKKAEPAPSPQKRTLPIQRLDIMPIFSEKSAPLESLFREYSGMQRDLFDAFIKSARTLYKADQQNFNERALIALEFEDSKMREAYFKVLKGGLFNRVKCKSVNAKIPVHQICPSLVQTLFTQESAARVIEQRERVIADAKEPCWKIGDLHMLKTKDSSWRELLGVELDSEKESALFEVTESQGAQVERAIKPLG